MPIYHSKKFRESSLAHQLLDGLMGLEIGGAAHNAFGLDTLNVDRFPIGSPGHKAYAEEQINLCGEVMPVDIVAPGDKIPVKDQSYDFVISSHVIEHFYDPIAAIKEWQRIARQYVYIICPHRDALESDRDKPLTELSELLDRHKVGANIEATDDHHSRWTPDSFLKMCSWINHGTQWSVVTYQINDDKVGNGFTVVLGK
jgi:hypothetical protein